MRSKAVVGGATGGRAGRFPLAMWLLVAVAGCFLLVVTPVVLRGGLLADEYVICMRPIRDGGYADYIQAIWQDTGAVRPARFIELFLISKTCASLPYGLVILVPLALKFTAAFLLLGLLRDIGVRTPWPEIGTALWLLEPMGAEAALWPAALHVLLGLVLALMALRLFRRGALGWAALATLGAALSVEQVIFALPLAVWVVTPSEERRRATLAAAAIGAMVLVAYAVWPGENERQALSLGERFGNLLAKREWYVLYPAMGLGLHSGILGFLSSLPYSVVAVVAGGAGGAVVLPALLSGHSPMRPDPATVRRGVLSVALLVVLTNLPLGVTDVGYTGRTFTPTWLVLSGAAAAAGSMVAWRRVRLLGSLAGLVVAFALLSIALSVNVRVRTDEFNRTAADWIANRTVDGAVVAVCDVERTVVNPAPLGAFHLHALHSTHGDWIEYHTGRVVQVRRSGERYWGSRCPDLRGADLVIRFPELVREVEALEG